MMAIPIRYKLATFLKGLAADPLQILYLLVFAVAAIFIVSLLVDAFVQKRKFNRLKKPYSRGRA
jgi:hypothetical protein